MKKHFFITLIILMSVILSGCSKTNSTQTKEKRNINCGDYSYENCPESCVADYESMCPTCDGLVRVCRPPKNL